MKRATIAIRGGTPAHAKPGVPVVDPLVQSVSHVQQIGTSDGLLYTRTGGTPNVTTLERRLALLEGANAAVVLSSGMGAISCALIALLRPGDHLVSSAWIYGGARELFIGEFRTLGIEVTFVDPNETRAWKQAIQPNTRAVFLETPVNPTCRVLDLRPIANLAREAGIALVVDSTLASPINFRPLEHGADIVVHSATKFLNGHHDVLGGVVLGESSYIDIVRDKSIKWGQTPDPFACWLLERSLKTLDVRIKRHNENAHRLAEWCANRPEFSQVNYPGLANHPDYPIARETLDGFGGMLGITMVGGGDAATKFLKRLRLVLHAPSLGGVDTLVSEPRYTSHGHMSSDERAAIGVPDGFLRVSVGLEDVDDLIADFEQALG